MVGRDWEIRVGSVLYDYIRGVAYTVTQILPADVIFVTWEHKSAQRFAVYSEGFLRAHLEDGTIVLAEEEFW